jgi:hypothetical protein
MEILKSAMHKLQLFLLIFFFEIAAFAQAQVIFNSNNIELNQAFDWAKNKALSFAHDGSDPVGLWYEAALPSREAFCMRDVSHQALGAQILGLGKHNLNMFQKFADNISADKDYCSYWEINRYNKPAPVDYQNDKDFWYNLPANFDVIYNAHRLYNWTGDKTYIDDPAFKKFYALSMNEYMDHWQLGYNQITKRSRAMHNSAATRFGASRGIPTYNEGGRGETVLGIDLSASIIAASNAYSAMLKLSGQSAEANTYLQKVKQEQKFLDEFWWDKSKQEYRSIQYADGSFDYFMVEDNQAYLHYLLYYNAIDDPAKIKKLVEDYRQNFQKLIVELKSYLPIIFYENGYSSLATKMIIDLCDPENKRRDYPENSYTVIEHVTCGLMGVEVNAALRVSTLSRLEAEDDWAEMNNIPLLSNTVSVKHVGKAKTVFMNQSGPSITWCGRIPGNHDFLYVNGKKRKSFQGIDHGQQYSGYSVEVKAGKAVTVSVNK